MSESLRNKTLKGFIWSSTERFSTQGVNFILGIFIARLLSPSDYGIIAMLNIFFAISTTFIDSGFSTALIRKIDRTESDNSTVFYFNLLIGCTATLVLFLCAPYIGRFFEMPILVPVTRVLSFSLVLGSFSGIQQALLTARIDFKTQAKISLSVAVASGVLGLSLAYAGLGVWALVAQMMSATLLRSVLLWILVKWRPTMPFSRRSFNNLFSFGSKLLASSLLDTTYNNIYTLVIGKIFSAGNLGNYSRAAQFAQFPSSNITSIIQRVTFPVLSSIQNEDERLAANYRKLLRMSAFIIFPLMTGLSAVARPLVLTLLTPKWSEAAVFLHIICFGFMWYPIHAINLNLLQVKGRSDLFLRLEIIKKLIGVSVLCCTIPMGLVAMCTGQIFTSIIGLVVNTYYTGKLIQVGFFKQIHDLLPTLLASLTMGIAVYYLITLFRSNLVQLIAGIGAGSVLFFAIVYLFKFKEITYIQEIIARK